MDGIKHLVQCHCVLPQFRKTHPPVYHQFVVFSIVNNDDTVQSKFVECNNCSAVHKVTEIGKSSIDTRKEGSKFLTTIDDIQVNLPDKLVQILGNYKADLPTWEEAQFCLENEKWGREIVLVKDTVDNEVTGKILQILGKDSFRITSFTREEYI